MLSIGEVAHFTEVSRRMLRHWEEAGVIASTSADEYTGYRQYSRTRTGVELLIRHGKAVYKGAPWVKTEGDRASLDVDTLLAESGAWSGGERRLAAIAAALLSEDHTVNLNDAITGVNRKAVTPFLAAIAHASGSHGRSGYTFDDDGRPTSNQRQPSLYPWPEAQ